MSVRLDGALEKRSAAGIVYRASRGESTFSAFVLSAHHSVAILRGEGNHLKIDSTWKLDGIKDGGSVRLKVEGDGRVVRLCVGDKLVTADEEAAPSGSPCAFAMSRGCFVFDDVTVELPSSAQ